MKIISQIMFFRLKKKRKVSTSSSSSSSSSDSSSDVSISSSSSSSDHMKRRKKCRKRSESSRSSKKYTSRASSHYKDQIRKEECYSPPADTSASFLNQSFEVEKLLERQDSSVCPKTEVKETHCSFSRTSGDDEDTFGGRSEASGDSYSSSRTLPSSSKTEKCGEIDRFSSSWRGSSASYCKSYDKPSMHYFRRSERDVEGRKEPFKKHGSGHKRYYVSPAGSDYYGKSAGKYRSYSSTSFREGDKSYDWDRHVLSKHKNESEYKSTRSSEETSKTKEPDEETSLEGTGQRDSGIKRNLPQNLINIFNQIAEFEREKGSKQKKE